MPNDHGGGEEKSMQRYQQPQCPSASTNQQTRSDCDSTEPSVYEYLIAEVSKRLAGAVQHSEQEDECHEAQQASQ